MSNCRVGVWLSGHAQISSGVIAPTTLTSCPGRAADHLKVHVTRSSSELSVLTVTSSFLGPESSDWITGRGCCLNPVLFGPAVLLMAVQI